jgi:large subunit ribosomal protein L5
MAYALLPKELQFSRLFILIGSLWFLVWNFLDRLINLAMPRIKDFRGVSDKTFDRQGNFAMGLSEQAVWPEINMANINHSHGMNINIVFTHSDPKKSRLVLAELGMPFVKPEETSSKPVAAAAAQ